LNQGGKKMKERKYRYSEIGMLMGLLIGIATGAAMYIITGEVFYFGLLGVGLALGTGMGAAYEKRKDPSQQENV
jgi:hypothetical protein